MPRPRPSKFLLIHHINLDAEQSVYWERRNLNHKQEYDADFEHEILYCLRLQLSSNQNKFAYRKDDYMSEPAIIMIKALSVSCASLSVVFPDSGQRR
jgi:hypothetical protein